MLKQKHEFNEQLSEDVDERLPIQNNETNESNMDVDNPNTIVSSLRALKLSAVERFIDNYKQYGNALFSSFEIYDNTHACAVIEKLMRDIATFARKNLGMSKIG